MYPKILYLKNNKQLIHIVKIQQRFHLLFMNTKYNKTKKIIKIRFIAILQKSTLRSTKYRVIQRNQAFLSMTFVKRKFQIAHNHKL